MSANDTTRMDRARQRLVTACAEMGNTEAVRMIVAEALGPGSEGLCMGTKAPEARPTQAEQIDAIAAKVAARTRAQEVAA
jgi:hypothetical protein